MKIEQQIIEAVNSAVVDRDVVRSWLMAERKRLSRNRICKFSLGTIVFLVLGWGLIQAFELEAEKVRRIVANPPTRTMVTLNEITNELCNQPPAEYWVRQLTIAQRIRSNSSM